MALRTARAALEGAADEIDADPRGSQERGRALRSLRLRALVETVAAEVMDRVGRALGAGPLVHDAAHWRRVADLTVYLRQHHAERDLAALGALAPSRGAAWAACATNPIDAPGTPEADWRAWPGARPASRAPPMTAGRSAVVIAAHPDDEVLGVGGLLSLLAAGAPELRVVAVTDAERRIRGGRSGRAGRAPGGRDRRRAARPGGTAHRGHQAPAARHRAGQVPGRRSPPSCGS